MTPKEKLELITQELAGWGISETTVRELAMQYDLDLIAEHQTYTRAALQLKWVNNPAGWFIASLRGNWGAPTPPRRKWYDEKYEQHIMRERNGGYYVRL